MMTMSYTTSLDKFFATGELYIPLLCLNQIIETNKEWMSPEWVSQWVSEWVNGKYMNKWVNEWMNEWMSEWVSEWMNEWMSVTTFDYIQD